MVGGIFTALAVLISLQPFNWSKLPEELMLLMVTSASLSQWHLIVTICT